MRVQKLWIRDFRNVEELGFEPSPGINFLVGSNGQGKTSILEALAYLASLRSFRGSKTPEVLRWGQAQSEIKADIVPENSSWKAELKILFERPHLDSPRASKSAWINGKSYRSSTSYLSQRFGEMELGFHTVVFNPSDHDLVRGEPALRRHFIDRVLAAEDVEYLETLQRFHRVLEQRNSLLKESHQPPDRSVLQEFTVPLVKLGVQLVLKRLEWLQKLREPLAQVALEIAPKQPSLRAFYLSNWVPKIDQLSIYSNNLDGVHFTGQDPLPSVEVLEQTYWKELSSRESAEWRAGHTLVGPHRDDWAFFFGDQWLRGHGSQGETRTALLALKLAELQLFGERTGHRPLFLLDDFSSELDRERRQFLLGFLERTDLQVFVTTTEDTHWVGRRIWVSNGKLNDDRKHFDRTTYDKQHSEQRLLSGQDQNPRGP